VTPSGDDVQRLIAQFKSDLKQRSESDIVHKHILTGLPVAVPEPGYFEIRRSTAQAFNICPSEVLIVGSCRMGFSIKDDQLYSAIRPDSDIDIAIVSESLFQEYWEAVFRFATSDSTFRTSEKYLTFAKDLAKGWIMPRGLPQMRSFLKTNTWVTHFDRLGGKRFHGPEPRNINAKLYRSWSRLQAYQEILVRKRRHDLVRSHS
jgi:hypothetical protein